MKKHNFSAGPAILPQEVIQGAAQAVLELDNIGLSLIEISHRSKEFIGIINYSIMALIQLELGVVENPDLSSDEATELYNKHKVN